MNRPLTIASAAAVAAIAFAPVTSQAAGNLASRPTYLETEINGPNKTFSQTEFQLEAGKYYIWEITSDGVEETLIRAPELFRNAWINQVTINDKEIHTSGSFYGVEYDAAGTIAIAFVPVRPGTYDFYAEGYDDAPGFHGTFVVGGSNMASGATPLPLAINGANLTYSQTEFELETGKYYRWEITSDGIEETMVQSPDLFRNSWINQLVIDDLELKVDGAIYGVEYDDAGTVEITFVPLRPGNYEFYSPGYEERGLRGTFIVR